MREAMDNLKQWIVDRNVAALSELWTEDYTFINPQGRIVTRAQRLANLSSGNTDVTIIDSEREITIRVYGDMAVVQNLSTLLGGDECDHGEGTGAGVGADVICPTERLVNVT